jgi:cation transport regulator
LILVKRRKLVARQGCQVRSRPRDPDPTPLEAKVIAMPYRTNTDLPPAVRAHLPSHAQDIYREAFNHAFASHAEDERQEEIAHRTAWAAVKRSYVKADDHWEPLHHSH